MRPEFSPRPGPIPLQHNARAALEVADCDHVLEIAVEGPARDLAQRKTEGNNRSYCFDAREVALLGLAALGTWVQAEFVLSLIFHGTA